MLSRVADSLYWMSRYLERAEHTARLIDVDVQLRLDQLSERTTERWQRLLAALQIPPALVGGVDATTLPHTLTFSRSVPSSIVLCIAAARENLRHVREQCSSEMWEHLNRLYLKVIESHAHARPEDGWNLVSLAFFRSVQEGVHLFQGITDSTMSHGEGWHFSYLPTPPDQAVESEDYLEWVGLLKCSTAFEAYCKVYSAEVRPLRVAEFLLLNREFPHSVRFSVEMVQAALQEIGELTQRKAALPVRIAGRLKAELSFSQIDEIMADGAHAYLANIRAQCTQAHTAIQQIYFDYPIESAVAS